MGKDREVPPPPSFGFATRETGAARAGERCTKALAGTTSLTYLLIIHQLKLWTESLISKKTVSSSWGGGAMSSAACLT